MKIALAVIVIAFVAYTLATAMRRKTANSKGADFFARRAMSAAEQVLYFRLTEALPDHIVLAQVQLSRVVGIKKGPHWQAWFNKISRKSLDFLICRKDASVIAAIELDDKSHDTAERQSKDADKDAALTGAGVRIIRWRASEIPSVELIRETMQAATAH